MSYFPPPTPLVLYTSFTAEECEHRLREAIDEERGLPFSFSGYRGSKPFIGEVGEKRFRVLQRIYSGRNSFPPVLTGEFQPQGLGTLVKGSIDLELTSKIAICIFAVVGLLILIPTVTFAHASHPALSIVFACAYGCLSLFGPRIYRGAGRNQEKRIADFIRETLVAQDFE